MILEIKFKRRKHDFILRFITLTLTILLILCSNFFKDFLVYVTIIGCIVYFILILIIHKRTKHYPLFISIVDNTIEITYFERKMKKFNGIISNIELFIEKGYMVFKEKNQKQIILKIKDSNISQENKLKLIELFNK
jgi:hypothetical protein